MIAAFCFLLVVPRALRVASAFAVRAARASTDKGFGVFLGTMASAARVVGFAGATANVTLRMEVMSATTCSVLRLLPGPSGDESPIG